MRKNGISLIVLIITIVVGLILIATTIVTIKDAINNAGTSAFVDEMGQIQDAVNSYYIDNNSLPTLDIINKDDILNIVQDRASFEEELKLNYDDDTSTFYSLDMDLIGVKQKTKGNLKTNTDIYIVSPYSMKVYYLKGININDNIFYSLTPRIATIVNLEEKYINQNTSLQNTNGVLIKASTNNEVWTNHLDTHIKISNLDVSTDEIIFEFPKTTIEDGLVIEEKIINGSFDFSFDNIIELFRSGKFEQFYGSADVSQFLVLPQEDKKINVLVKRNGAIIAKEVLKYPGFEFESPNLTLSSYKVYENMKLLSLEVSDTTSGVREVRYDYLRKWNDSKTSEIKYYPGISNFNEEHMRTKSKVKTADEIVNGKVDIKIPIEITCVTISVIDNAGNIISINYEIK